MAIEIKAPVFPESVSEGSIAKWHKQPGEHCATGEILVDVETDKVVLEVVAPEAGTLQAQLKAEGDTIASGEVLGHLVAGEASAGQETAAAGSESVAGATTSTLAEAVDEAGASFLLSPAARRLAEEHGIQPDVLVGSGKGGRVTKEDVLAFVRVRDTAPGAPAAPAATPAAAAPSAAPAAGAAQAAALSGDRIEERVPMTRLRARVAERLLRAQQSAAMLTTFNEVNMAPIMALRKQYRDVFEKRHGVKLGFMSFFVKAAVEALKRHPVVNASIDGQDIVYHGYQDIGVAVSSERGLVVPVIRDAEHKSLAELESGIRDYGIKARDGKLAIEDMTGGTFTISNGGVFGSLLSTPILNPPQSAILGMHKIQERPMAVDGEVVILPMMYLALSYDHRLLDGKEAVTFLVTMKELLEDPARILLAV